jgi:hypothetical protein
VEDTDFFYVPCLGLHAYLLDEGVVGRCMRRKGGVGEKEVSGGNLILFN